MKLRKLVALLLSLLMLVSVAPMSVLAVEETSNENSTETYDIYSDDYYFRYNFDSVAAGTSHDGYISKVGESDSNPYGLELDGSMLGSVQAHSDGSGKYYAARYTNTSWRAIRLSLINGTTDYSVANGVEVCFRLRWVGTGDVSENATMRLVAIRRALTSGRFDFDLLSSKVDQITGDLIVMAARVYYDSEAKVNKVAYDEIYRVPKMSDTNKKFTEFKVVYHDVTNTYSVYINGETYVESFRCASDPRSSSAVTTTYDSDFFATRTPVSGANDKWSLQMFRIDWSSTAGKNYNYHFDVDDIVIREGDWYTNSFETAATTYNDFSKESVVSTYAFNVRNGSPKIVTESNGNKYLSMPAGSRVDLKDYAYQMFQDGNWTIDFKVKADGAANIMRYFDRTNTHQFLKVDADGNLTLGSIDVPGVTVPKIASDEWLHLTVSFLVDDVNANKFDNFISYNRINSRRGYRIALWVDGVYIGTSLDFARSESIASGSGYYTLNDYYYDISTLTEAPDVSGMNTLADNNGRYTYEDASGNIYQYTLTDGAFASGVKLTRGSISNADVLGFWDAGSSAGAFDDISIYKGVGPKEYATDKVDTEGVISDIDFGKISVKSTHIMSETPHNTGGGVLYSNTNGVPANFTKVDATGTEKAYVAVANDGSGRGFFDLRADNSGGKVFAGEWTVRNFTTAADMDIFILRRQKENDSGSIQSPALRVEKDTSYLYFNTNGAKYYLSDEEGNLITLKTSSWTTVKAIFDETGSETLVTFLINDKVAYYTGVVVQSIPFPTRPAVSVSGVISSHAYNARNYIDQRVRLYDLKDAAFSFDTLSASIEYATVPEVVVEEVTYSDFAMIDFGDYANIDELKEVFGDQIYVSGNVTIENGVLNVPAGARFAWLDVNGTFANHWNNAQPVSGLTVNGYTVEMRLKTDFTGDGLLKVNLVCGADSVARTAKIASISADGDKNILVGSNQSINKLSSDRFSDLSFTFTNSAMYSTIFVDGNYAGLAGFWKQFNNADSCVSFEVPAGSQLEKLYIHADIRRELAMESGDIFRLDPNIHNPVGSLWDEIAGITNNGGVLGDTSFTSVQTYTNGDESFDYFKLNFKHPDDAEDAIGAVNSSHWFTDVSLTDYLTDKVSVIEFDLRFTPHAQDSDVTMDLIWFRRATGATSNHFGESILTLTCDGTLMHSGKLLYNADGTPVVISSENWTNVAAIYDATAGQVSFRVGGKVPHYLVGEELVLAEDIQLESSRNYRLDAFETRMRTFSCVGSETAHFLGSLDVAYLDIYTVDSTDTANYIGAQKDTESNNIRLVAGLDHLYFGSAGFEVEVLDANGTSVAAPKTYATDIVYSSIIEETEGGNNVLYPEDYGYRYFYTANVLGVDTANAAKLKVTPFTTVNGKQYNASTVVLDIDFTSSEPADWTLTTASTEVKPYGTNSSKDANFSTTDVVTYTNDGGLDFNGRNAQFAFAADLKGGVVSVNLTNSFGEVVENSVLDIYVDGELKQEDLTLDFGHHTLVLAENLTGEHTFKIVKKTGGDYIRINNMSVTGEFIAAPALADENAVNLVVHAPASGSPYGSANVYVKTSDASGKYYINYQFSFINWALNNYDYTNGVANSHNNAFMYRINTAMLVEKTDTGYKDVFQVLQGGEISLAIKEVWNGAAAKDFVGGWHGDENIEGDKVYMYLDGNAIDITKAGNYTGTSFVFDQTCLISRCDTEETNTMRHRQYMVLDTNGLRNKQTVEFLVGDFVGDRSQSYLQMCTFNRQNFSLSETERVIPDNFISKSFNMLDANGGTLSSHTLTTDGDTGVGSSSNTNNRYVEYLGNNNGLYGLVGFVIGDQAMNPHSVRVQIRVPQGDNKLYASFAHHFGSAVPKYEMWSIDDYYFIDYNTANVTTETN